MAFRSYLIEEITIDCADGALTRREAIRRLGSWDHRPRIGGGVRRTDDHRGYHQAGDQ